MTRTYITNTDSEAPREYFDMKKAQRWDGSKEWDGNNQVDINTRVYYATQYLYRTAGGRWVINTYSQWQGTPETFEWATDEQAHDWLLFNGLDEVAAKFFGPAAEERGPGRPEIGGRVCVRLGDELLSELDTWAEAHGKTRADAVRYCVSHFAHAE